VVASGTPEHVAAVAASHTGRYLKPILGRAGVSRPTPTAARASAGAPPARPARGRRAPA
jgi:excinuclease ABC subunit A